MDPRRVHIVTVGCKLNQADSYALAHSLEVAGHTVVPAGEHHAPPRADVYIVNTCTVTARADHDSRRHARRLKRLAPESLVVVVGCLAETDGDDLAAIPEIDWLVPRAAVVGLPEALLTGRAPSAVTSRSAGPLDVRSARPRKARAPLVVQDGCDRRCAYCKVPLARGEQRSLPLDAAVTEAVALAEAGYAEIVLEGCNLGAYGEDLTPPVSLAELLSALLAHDLPRIRLSSVEPDLVTDAVCELIASSAGRICPHVHLPLQSGSESVLRAMGRPTDLAPVVERLAWLRAHSPLLAIGLDLLTGFPTERDEDFLATRACIERIRPSRLHVFTYSPRPGTAAFGLGDPVPPQEKKRRARELAAVRARLAEEFAERHVGTVVGCVVDRIGTNGVAEGVTETYLRASTAGTGTVALGRLVRMEVTARDRDRLLGRPIPVP